MCDKLQAQYYTYLLSNTDLDECFDIIRQDIPIFDQIYYNCLKAQANHPFAYSIFLILLLLFIFFI
jgi:hypothetical protein